VSSLALAKRELSRETFGVNEKPALKKWLRDLRQNSGYSHDDVADLMGVTPKTVKNLQSSREGFGHGDTLLRYLKVLGALPDAPMAPPGQGRLARLEARVEQTRILVVEGLGLQDRARELEAELSLPPEDPTAQSDGGTP
jgi:transcriptional regulator with XRE-family HTH domain